MGKKLCNQQNDVRFKMWVRDGRLLERSIGGQYKSALDKRLLFISSPRQKQRKSLHLVWLMDLNQRYQDKLVRLLEGQYDRKQ